MASGSSREGCWRAVRVIHARNLLYILTICYFNRMSFLGNFKGDRAVFYRGNHTKHKNLS